MGIFISQHGKITKRWCFSCFFAGKQVCLLVNGVRFFFGVLPTLETLNVSGTSTYDFVNHQLCIWGSDWICSNEIPTSLADHHLNQKSSYSGKSTFQTAHLNVATNVSKHQSTVQKSKQVPFWCDLLTKSNKQHIVHRAKPLAIFYKEMLLQHFVHFFRPLGTHRPGETPGKGLNSDKL